MTSLNPGYLGNSGLRLLSAVDLSEAGIPSRFWRPSADPFIDFPSPLSWWESRNENCAQGVGYLAVSAPDSLVELSSLVELLKRVMADRQRPALVGSLRGTCRFVRAPDLYRGKWPTAGSGLTWDELTGAGFLLVANIGVGHNAVADRVLPDLFRARYENGAVTFFHIVERSGDKEFLQRVVSLIPNRAYTV